MNRFFTNKIVLICIGLQICISCDYFQQREEKQAVARVGKVMLYKEQVDALQTQNISAEDSTNLVNAYIGNWIRSQTILQEAQNQLTAKEIKEIEEKVSDYQESLLKFRYESQLVSEKLDTIITDEEIETYYLEHEQDFQIQEPLLRFLFVQKDQPIENPRQVNTLFEQIIEEDNDSELQSFCLQMIQCRTDYASYVPLSLLYETFEEAPSNTISLSINRLHQLQTENYEYLYRILEIKNSGTAPLEYVADDIRKIIIRNREQQLLEQLRIDIYEKAKTNNQIERFD